MCVKEWRKMMAFCFRCFVFFQIFESLVGVMVGVCVREREMVD